MGRISMPQGKGSLMHNRREYELYGQEMPDHIDPSRVHLNVVLVDKDIREAYKEIFGESVKRYNDRQSREDRKIEDYYEKIKKSKMAKIFSMKMSFNGERWKTLKMIPSLGKKQKKP